MAWSRVNDTHDINMGMFTLMIFPGKSCTWTWTATRILYHSWYCVPTKSKKHERPFIHSWLSTPSGAVNLLVENPVYRPDITANIKMRYSRICTEIPTEIDWISSPWPWFIWFTGLRPHTAMQYSDNQPHDPILIVYVYDCRAGLFDTIRTSGYTQVLHKRIMK